MNADWSVKRGEKGYPESLAELQEPPAALHGVGDRRALVELEHAATVTIVGARRASDYGLRTAEELARDLAFAGIAVVSGMAYGIDAAAHRGALAGGGCTLAVLGGGPDVVYPPSNRGLHRQIAAAGAVVSEHPPGTETTKWSFPARNRIMAGLSCMTIVVEAAEPSGTLITADETIRLGRDLGAVPGQVGSRLAAGPHALIRDGATLIRGAQDVLDLMLGIGQTSVARSGPALQPELAPVLDRVERGAATPDAVAVAAGIAPHEAAVALARLELLGYVAANGSGRYERTSLSVPDDPALADDRRLMCP
jgi:DNA processing protein